MAALLLPTGAAASTRVDPARVYLEARAAAIEGDHSRSAALLARLVDSTSASPTIIRNAVSQAISAGDMKLALRLSKLVPEKSMPIDGKLLQAGEALRSGDAARALDALQGASEGGDLSFLRPFVEAWGAADAGDQAKALKALQGVGARNMLAALAPEHRAFILLKFGRVAEADQYVIQALKGAGGREQRLRSAFADSFLVAGDRARALNVVEKLGNEANRAKERIEQRKQGSALIDNGRRAFSELLIVLAAELNRMQSPTMPIVMAQIARYVAPENGATAIVAGLMLAQNDRIEDALAAFRSVPVTDSFAVQARDAEVRALIRAEREEDALQAAQGAMAGGSPNVDDYTRLGDAFAALKRHDEAAAAYSQALGLAADAKPEERWPLLLLQASALEEKNRWHEARHALTQALALAPDEPLILNFLGYAKLERGEDMDAAEALIRKASQLAPDDASITDSLGWALYKRGRTAEAIEVLTRAAKADPSQAEIREHLGDALYKAGNRFEARYAWQAALVTADDEIASRVKAKIESGLTKATAAP